MRALYEEWAAETLSYAKSQSLPEEGNWADAYEEMASELLSLANEARVAA